ncbi:MAG TPA: phenylalanine--tRNA ligase subunit alpha [Kofleriaceae bacterium]|nr:phenylalanine--tRNA ligase subunit alpha [Kofleriaceae bacterium]
MTAAQLIAQLDRLGADFDDAIAPLGDEQSIRTLQARYLGKKGTVSQLMKEMGRLDSGARREVGVVVNRVKAAITDQVASKLASLAERERQADLARTVDVTLPGRDPGRGHAHVIGQVTAEVVAIFSELGFAEKSGPEVETDFHNFEALGTGPDHPARDMQDTFYVAGGNLLRTHTSPVQVRTMLAQKPPVRIIAPGVVFRRDDDATHSPMFVQIEGLVVDRGISLADLKGVLLHFARRFFGSDLEVRLRSSYFPFVEPGCEVDVQCAFCPPGAPSPTCRVCKGSGWLELAGAGMVDPVVFSHVGYDPEVWTGFAFGMGIDRMAMIRHGIGDIKHLYDGDLRFLRQF